MESGTEYAQTWLEQIGGEHGGGKSFTEAVSTVATSDEKRKERIEGFVQGLIGGTGLSAGSLLSAKQRSVNPTPNEKPSVQPQATEEVRPGAGQPDVPKNPQAENVQEQKAQEPVLRQEQPNVEEVKPVEAVKAPIFTTHKGEKVSGKKLSDALNKVADDWAESAKKVREEDAYASHVSEKEKDEVLSKDLNRAEEIRRGENINNLTIQQRINTELTGEEVPILPKKKATEPPQVSTPEKKVEGKAVVPNKEVKASKAEAIKEVAPKFKLKEMEAGMLHNLKDKTIDRRDYFNRRGYSDSFTEPDGLKGQMFKKLVDAGYFEEIVTDEERQQHPDTDYILTDKGKEFIEAVDARYQTRKQVKSGQDMFPETANIPEFNPNKPVKEDAPKTKPTKSPDVPAAPKAVAERPVEQPKQESESKPEDDVVAKIEKLSENESQGYNIVNLRKLKEAMLEDPKRGALAMELRDKMGKMWGMEKDFEKAPLGSTSQFFYSDANSVSEFLEQQIKGEQVSIESDKKYLDGLNPKKKSDQNSIKFTEDKIKSAEKRIAEYESEIAKEKGTTVKTKESDLPIVEEKKPVTETKPAVKETKSKGSEKVSKAKEQLKERIQKVKQKHSDLYDENLGAIYDPKQRAKKHYEFHRELVGLAKDAIALGVANVQEFADTIGRKIDDFLTRAFEDAQREIKGEPVAIKSQRFFETTQDTSEQKENLSKSIETEKQDRSDYVKRRLKEPRDNPAFKKAADDKGQYNVQSMDLANKESDRLITDLQTEFGEKTGLREAFSALKEDQVPPLMEGPMASKLMLKMQALGMNKEAVQVLDWLQEGGRDAGRRLASLRADASPESTVSRLFAGLEKSKQEAMSKEFKDGKTYDATVTELRQKLDDLERKYKELQEKGTVDDKSILPDPEVIPEKKSKDIIQRAKTLRKEGLADLNKFFKKQRGQANMGMAVDPDLFKALGKILQSYIIEFEGNVMAAFDKFKTDVTAEHGDKIKSSDLESMKTELLEASEETIAEFKEKKQLQVIEKVLEPEGKKETPAERKKRKETARKILDDYNNNSTTEEIADNFKDVAGFETVTPEQRKKIVEMTNNYSQLSAEGKNELAYKEWYDLMMYLEDLGVQNRSLHDTIMDLWYTGVLSGLTTIGRSIKGSLLSTSNFTATRLLANPKVAPLAIAQMVKGLKGATSTYAHIMKTGKTTVNIQDFTPRLPRLTDRLWDKQFGDLKTGQKFLKAAYALPTFMYRNIIAFDQIIKDSVAEGNIAVFEFNKTSSERKLSERLSETQKKLQNERNKEVQAMVDDEIAVMKKAGEEVPKGYKDRRFREIKNELRNAEVVKRAVEEASRASLVSHPIGTLGHFYSYWERMMEMNDSDPNITKAGKYALRSIFPFMRIGFNYVNAGLDYTPVGFARALKNSVWTKDGVRPVDNFEKREYFARASVGLAVATTLFNSLFDWDDEEGLKLQDKKDRWIEIYGPLTGKWWEYDDVAKDARPWSIRVKNPTTGEWSGVYSYADNPMGFMLAPLGVMHDQLMFGDFKDKVQKKELKDEIKDVSYILGASIHGTFRYAMDQSFNQGMNTIGNLMAPESPEKFGQEVQNLALRPTQGFYPSVYRQMYDQYRALSDTPEKQDYHWYDKPAKLAPLVDNIVKYDKYDVFGYPIVRDFNVPLVPDIILKMAKDNLDYREDLKEWKLLHKYEQVTIGGSYLPPQSFEGKELTDEQKDEFVRTAGMEMRRLVNSHWESLNNMTPEKLQGRLTKYKGTALNKAEREVLKKKP